MQAAHIDSNPLIQSVLYRSLSHTINEIGLPEFPQEQFCSQIAPYLESFGSPMEENEQSLVKLWKSVLRGEVIATEVRDEQAVFYVRGGVRGVVIDLRLKCHKHQWQIESITSIHNRPMFRTPWFTRTTFVAAVAMAAILGYAIHQPTQAAKPTTAVEAATVLGKDPNAAGSRDTSSNSNTGQQTQRTVKFTLSPGMPLYDLSKFLYQQHLIRDAVGFDMELKKAGADRNVKPGVYTFQTGMSDKQIILVLQHAPSN